MERYCLTSITVDISVIMYRITDSALSQLNYFARLTDLQFNWMPGDNILPLSWTIVRTGQTTSWTTPLATTWWRSLRSSTELVVFNYHRGDWPALSSSNQSILCQFEEISPISLKNGITRTRVDVDILFVLSVPSSLLSSATRLISFWGRSLTSSSANSGVELLRITLFIWEKATLSKTWLGWKLFDFR